MRYPPRRPRLSAPTNAEEVARLRPDGASPSRLAAKALRRAVAHGGCRSTSARRCGDPKAGYLGSALSRLGCRWSLRAHAPFLRETTSWVQETAFLWVGGADATTGLHSDDEDNVLLVTHGSKHVLLYPPSSRRHLDPNPRYDNGTECCELDAFLSEAEKVCSIRRTRAARRR